MRYGRAGKRAGTGKTTDPAEAEAAVTAINGGNTLTGILTNIVSLLLPLRCAHCGREGGSLCSACARALEPVGAHGCSCCGNPAAPGGLWGVDGASCPECAGRELNFRRSRAAFAYRGPARSLVRALKFRNQRRLARVMAQASHGSAERSGIFREAVLVPVPMHPSRKYERGYNHAALYARELADMSGAVSAELLERIEATVPQNRLDYERRRENPRGSVALASGAGRRLGAGVRRVALVDDVYTTGSTASECARVLSGELGLEVDVWTFARTVKRWSKGTHFPMGD